MPNTAEEALMPDALPAVAVRRFGRWWLIVPLALAVGAAIYTIVLAMNWPFTRKALIAVLEQRSLRKVTVDRFQQTYFPPGCVAEGVRFLRITEPDKQAPLTIQKLVIEGNYRALLMLRRRLETVRVIGLHLMMPAKEPAGEPSPALLLTNSGPTNPVIMGTIYADGAVLEFLPETPGKPPLRLDVKKLALYEVGGRRPLSYRTEIYNPRPAGEIYSNGTWGPWDPKRPAGTPVKGEYQYENVNLASLPEMSGTLESRGSFEGALGQIKVDGKATVANFKLTATSHEQELKTDFQVMVDATKGDVYLTRILASFQRTALLVSGSVTGEKSAGGKTAELLVTAERARVEDLLALFMAARRPAMTGNVRLEARMTLPPGERRAAQRLRLKGSFGVDAGLFRNKTMEQELARVSTSAVKGDRAEDREDPQTVFSDIAGQVEAQGGLARFSRIRFNMPGVQATMNGTFDLINYRSDMHGVLVTQGNISDAASGMNSLFLKALTPFFKRKNHTKEVPFKVSGPYGHTTVSLDLMVKKR